MRAWFALVLIVILLVAGIPAYEHAVASAGDDQSVTNETIDSPTAGEVVILANSNQTGAYYDDDVSVYNETDVVMEPGSDYEWYESNGTLRVLSGGDLAGDANGSVTYSWQQTSEAQRDRADVVAMILGNISWIVLVAILLILMAAVGGSL